MPDNAESCNLGHMSKQPRTLPTGVKDRQQCPEKHSSAFRKDREKRTKTPAGTNPGGFNPESRYSLIPSSDLNTQLTWPKCIGGRKEDSPETGFQKPLP